MERLGWEETSLTPAVAPPALLKISTMRRLLLLTDSFINLLLGFVLLFFPPAVVHFLGAPPSEAAFYPSLFGAVLLGIGVALLLDLPKEDGHGDGLGLRGAVAINMCAGLALLGWLVWGHLEIPTRGKVFLWGLTVMLVGLSLVEVAVERVRARAMGV